MLLLPKDNQTTVASAQGMGRRFVTMVAIVGLGLLLAPVILGTRGTVAAAAPASSLLVESVPTGATVYVDGRFVGETPVAVTALPVGDHRVRLVKADYLEYSRVVSLGNGKAGALRVPLTKRAAQNGSAPASGLKIVVVEGEDAVNIIQQRTAVAPVIEVRDRNNQPVAGAVVRFAIQGGRASFNGARTLSVTTNLAGLPSISIPAGLDAQGLPLGLQVLGKPFDEETVFAVAAAIERAANFTAIPGIRAGA